MSVLLYTQITSIARAQRQSYQHDPQSGGRTYNEPVMGDHEKPYFDGSTNWTFAAVNNQISNKGSDHCPRWLEEPWYGELQDSQCVNQSNILEFDDKLTCPPKTGQEVK